MGFGDLNDVKGILVAPGEGKQQVRGHDKAYGEIRDGFDGVRDTCNNGIDKVNGWLEQAGRSERLPRLTEKSLDEYVVFPLSGNYYRIQQNGAACGILQKGMKAWGENFTTLSVSSVVAFEGQANLGFALHLNAYNLVMQGVGVVVKSGAGVFDSIARVSEMIAIRVEKALIEMGKKLLSLVKKVSKRFLGGWVSAALLIKDLAEKGLSVITEVVDDVKWCIAAIDKCFELKDEIETWAQTQADRLEAFKAVTEQLNQLPHVDLGTPLADIEVPDLTSIKELLDATDPDFGQSDEGQAAEDAVDKAGEELVTGSGYIHPSWAEACVQPPPGQAHLPYVPGDPAAVAPPRNPFTGEPWETPPGYMAPPTPGVSSARYYETYETWLQTLRPPRYSPPAVGSPRGA